MSDSIEIRRLTKAITDLASILVETTAARVREEHAAMAPPATRHVPRAIENLMTKRDVAAYLKVSLRTVNNLMKIHRLPYIRLGSRCLRFMLPDVENELKRRYRIGGL